MTADEWIAQFAEALGIEVPPPGEVEVLLDLAGAAAHSSERTAAPIACYLVGKVGLDATTALGIAEGIGERESG